ncbi:glycoside hydrolase family 2 TIM barrel-domain containing protein [Blastopirellula marina]|uniref:Glycoside hydrolase family 2 catalytic domain-containing protein n=1 Tax=Blastopirellula marina TaxID=124 RepID=A0A2S8GR89_9BACT|nr:glycoside hydrolase family 2 TIM barrel-domain containing protein [Blastopirellula marina]PQO46554.1 hypothetical protein C5Y93_08770 [Blastopirellula marina]
MQRVLVLSLVFAWLGIVASFTDAAEVKLTSTDQGHQLQVDGQPFPIRGAGGDGDKALLASSGGNAFRTWGIGDDTKARLDEAERLGLKVALGIWLGHERHGFNYDDPAQVQKQFVEAKAAVEKFKDHPALLLWGVGNEMEGYEATTDPKVWQSVNEIAQMIHQVDPHHPTMTVIAEIGGDKLASIGKYCPAVDIVGINSYGGVTSIPERYRAAGLEKPYIVTEFGPPGTWEIEANAWDVPLELTSTQKAEVYREAYDRLAADPNCLGSFAFTWGFKQEATATWFGMFLPDGTKVAAVDAMTEAWTGKPPANRCPRIDELTIAGDAIVEPGGKVVADLKVADPEGKPLKVEWILFREMDEFNSMGDYRPAPPTYPEAIVESSSQQATLKMPRMPGNYRLFAYIRDGDGGGAVGNLPLKVKGMPPSPEKDRGAAVTLPLVVYGDDMSAAPFVPSGYMGDVTAIVQDEKSTNDPHSGETCLEVAFQKQGGWGGVVWQSPANDWGDKPGGYDLSAADGVTFWARGERGGEKVKFGYGLIDRNKEFFDTAQAEIEVTLSQEWKEYRLPLTGRSGARIKSGFYWSLAGTDQPIKFYLDDIVYSASGKGSKPAPAIPMPLKLSGDDPSRLPYVPSGYMGDTAAIAMDDRSKSQPHSGETCTQVTFDQPGGWGGVVWQSPANDWGDLPGGLNLSEATRLTFWARGESEGERVKFGFGLLNKPDVAYPDSASGEREFTLTKEWKAYTFDLTGKDLRHIKTGFYWTVAGQGKKVTFYLDDLSYAKGIGD